MNSGFELRSAENGWILRDCHDGEEIIFTTFDDMIDYLRKSYSEEIRYEQQKDEGDNEKGT